VQGTPLPKVLLNEINLPNAFLQLQGIAKNRDNKQPSNQQITIQTKPATMMKKILFAAAALVAFTFSASAQRQQNNALKMNPVSLLVKTGNISYERAISKNQSIQLGAFYSGFSVEDVTYSGFGITPEYRFYFGGQKQALNGGYVAPYVRYQDFTIEKATEKAKADFTTLGGGAIIGWQKTWSSGFIVDVFAGPSYNHLEFDVKENAEEFDVKSSIKGFTLRTGITIGFTF
jgi:hypothetical protein